MIAIIKYNAGNIGSVKNALNRLGMNSIVTDERDKILAADKVIFPGVGEAGSAMDCLKEKQLVEVIQSLTQPVLGICLGMQLLCDYSEEGDTKCLGVFKHKVSLFPPEEKVPHMGWNNFSGLSGDLFKNITDSTDMYYVHSYYAGIGEDTIASCDYIRPFSAALQKNNFYATQFHPEKSAKPGEQLLKNFLEL